MATGRKLAPFSSPVARRARRLNRAWRSRVAREPAQGSGRRCTVRRRSPMSHMVTARPHAAFSRSYSRVPWQQEDAAEAMGRSQVQSPSSTGTPRRCDDSTPGPGVATACRRGQAAAVVRGAWDAASRDRAADRSDRQPRPSRVASVRDPGAGAGRQPRGHDRSSPRRSSRSRGPKASVRDRSLPSRRPTNAMFTGCCGPTACRPKPRGIAPPSCSIATGLPPAPTCPTTRPLPNSAAR